MTSKFDDRLVKPAYKKIEYTQKQVDELTKCMDPDTGPLYFITNFIYVQHPKDGNIQLKPYDFQIGLLEAYHKHRKSIAMISRQMGKSTIAGAYLLWYAMFNPDSMVLIASNKHDGALEIMHRIRHAYECLPNHIRAGVLSYNKKSIEFDNGSRIIAQTTTENTGRGLSVSLIYLDEFSFVEPRIAKELWTSISPTLATGGKIIITSTPNIDEDQFAQIWFGANLTTDEYGNETETGVNGFKAYFADWKAHPDRDEKWAKEQIEDLGTDKFAREHLCKFISFEETLIDAEVLHDLKGVEPIERVGQVRWYKKKINPDFTYIVGLDPAMGTGGDSSGIQVWELPTMEQVAEWQHNKTPVEGQISTMREILKELSKRGAEEIYWSVENNNLGEAALVVIRDTGEENFPGTMVHDPKAKSGAKRRKGFTTTNSSKMEMCSRLKSLIETGKIKIKSKALISELKTFVSRQNTFTARSGTKDDLIMALILVLRMTEYVASWDDISRDALNASVLTEEDEGFDSPMPFVFM